MRNEMTDSKGITLNPGKVAQWLTIAIIIIGSIVDSALMRDQVKRNTEQLEKNPPAVFAIEQKNMADDVEEIKQDVKDLVEAFTNYMLTHQ